MAATLRDELASLKIERSEAMRPTRSSNNTSEYRRRGGGLRLLSWFLWLIPLSIVSGADALMIQGTPAAHNAHCGSCGSLLYSVVREGAFVHVAMGTLVDVPSIRPSAHIFVGSKAPWFTITDDLPQYDGHVVAG